MAGVELVHSPAATTSTSNSVEEVTAILIYILTSSNSVYKAAFNLFFLWNSLICFIVLQGTQTLPSTAGEPEIAKVVVI